MPMQVVSLRCLLVFIPWCLFQPFGQAQLADRLQPVVDAWKGDIAVAVRHLETGEEYFWRSDDAQPTASLIKLAVMVTAYRAADSGDLDLHRMITLTDADKVPGSGILTDHLSSGITLSVRDAIRLMIRYSDNTATNLVIDQIGLPQTTATMEQLGFPATRLHAKVFRGETSLSPERSKRFGLGSTTARETVDLLTGLHRGTVASEAACKSMIEHLLQCDDDTKIGAGLPAGTKFANKTGSVTASRTDAGIVYGPRGPFAVCVLTTNNSDRSWKEDNSAHQVCATIGQLAFEYFNPPSATPGTTGPQSLQSGSSGELVEMLQRTLNARMQPSPELSVDGDFGSVTEAAVRRFQEMHSLPVTGIVDAACWKVIGPVVPPEEIPPPESINAQVLPKLPADDFSGPPVVTCKAWAMVDIASGKTLWSHSADMPLDFASTTKIMTAWLVIRQCQEHPEVLDEMLVMSDRADQTGGSTSGVKAGETLPVREALYGLMLPSGNDMSVALAEHFGHRLRPQTAASESSDDPLAAFVAAMNAEAVRLGMTQTNFCNPHGLTESGHVSTANDLAILARTAVGNELFQHYVNTRQHGVTVESLSGYQRNVMWQNTNQLLGIDGYSGIKTGTTDKAGACLVSTSRRGDRQLLLVILGSAASESRYADSRNLYRWAWQQPN